MTRRQATESQLVTLKIDTVFGKHATQLWGDATLLLGDTHAVTEVDQFISTFGSSRNLRGRDRVEK